VNGVPWARQSREAACPAGQVKSLYSDQKRRAASRRLCVFRFRGKLSTTFPPDDRSIPELSFIFIKYLFIILSVVMIQLSWYLISIMCLV